MQNNAVPSNWVVAKVAVEDFASRVPRKPSKLGDKAWLFLGKKITKRVSTVKKSFVLADCFVLKGGALARRAYFFYHSQPVAVFAPTLPNNLDYLLTVFKNLT